MFQFCFLLIWTHLSDKDGLPVVRLRASTGNPTPRGRTVWPRYVLFQGQHRTGTDQDAIFGIKRVRLHEIELHHDFLPVLELTRTILRGLFDTLNAARAPHLDGGGLPIGTLNFVKVHDADDFLGLILHFFEAVSYKLGDDHTAARQEVFNYDILFHVFFGLLRDKRRHGLRRWKYQRFVRCAAEHRGTGGPADCNAREASPTLRRLNSFMCAGRHAQHGSDPRNAVSGLGQTHPEIVLIYGLRLGIWPRPGAAVCRQP